MGKNILTLAQSAYIFHWSNSNYFFGTRKEYERKCAYRKALFALYDAGIEERTFEYEMDERLPAIEIDGLHVLCKPCMIEHICGDYDNASVINSRTWPTLNALPDTEWEKHNSKWVTSRMFTTSSLDVFDDLQYIQLSWKGDKFRFIYSNNQLYELEDDGCYTPIDVNKIIATLDIKSIKAKRHVLSLFNTLFPLLH